MLSCANAPEWVYSTSYWTGTVNGPAWFYAVDYDGSISSEVDAYSYDFGVRPVIEIPISEF